MAATLLGLYHWGLTSDDDGHRTYTAQFRVKTDDTDDGPAVVFATAGLPLAGATWAYGNDVDLWAFCLPKRTVRTFKQKGEPGNHWLVQCEFTTKPQNRCQTTSIENPLNEPARLSGSYVKYVREATVDRNGDPILTSSHEIVTGPVVERDFNRPTVRVGLTLASLPLSTFNPMVDTLNDATLWGLAARKVKLSNVSWTRLLYGTCTYYYTVDYEFEISDEWDTTYVDQGTMVLAPGGDATNPQHFVRYKDGTEENATVLLDGNGNALDAVADVVNLPLEKYDESNFLLLGIPTTL